MDGRWMNSPLSLMPVTILVVELCWNYPDVPGGGVELDLQPLDFTKIYSISFFLDPQFT